MELQTTLPGKRLELQKILFLSRQEAERERRESADEKKQKGATSGRRRSVKDCRNRCRKCWRIELQLDSAKIEVLKENGAPTGGNKKAMKFQQTKSRMEQPKKKLEPEMQKSGKSDWNTTKGRSAGHILVLRKVSAPCGGQAKLPHSPDGGAGTAQAADGGGEISYGVAENHQNEK